MGYSGPMDRATLKVKPETAARLRDTMPELSTAAGRMLTIDQALNFLLDTWADMAVILRAQRSSGAWPSREVPGGPA